MSLLVTGALATQPGELAHTSEQGISTFTRSNPYDPKRGILLDLSNHTKEIQWVKPLSLEHS